MIGSSLFHMGSGPAGEKRQRVVQHIELLQAALGLEHPWYVVRYDFSPQERRLDLFIDFEAGAKFACPVRTCELQCV